MPRRRSRADMELCPRTASREYPHVNAILAHSRANRRLPMKRASSSAAPSLVPPSSRWQQRVVAVAAVSALQREERITVLFERC